MRQITPSLDHLQTLAAFAESRNMTECARILGVSQGTISLRLAQLQEQLPHPLFETRGRKKVLTAYALSIFQELRSHLGNVSSSLERINSEFGVQKESVLRVGGRRELMPWILKHLLPHAALRLFPSSSEQVVQRLLSGDLDIGISHLRPDVLHIRSKKIFKSGTFLAVHEKWLKNKPLTMDLVRNHAFLKNVPCLSYGEFDRVLELWVNHVGFRKADLQIKIMYDDWQTLIHQVAEGAGFCFLPENIPSHYPNVHTLNVDSVIPRWNYYLLFQNHLLSTLSVKNILKNISS